MNPFRSEPTAAAAAILALIYIAAAFGAPISTEQQQVLRDNIPVVLGGLVLLAAWVRAMVYAPDTVGVIEDRAFADGFKEGVDSV